jgi:hypothetical protein
MVCQHIKKKMRDTLGTKSYTESNADSYAKSHV